MSCEFCKDDRPIGRARDNDMQFRVLGQELFYADAVKGWQSLPISHCPKCGQFLGEDVPLTLEELLAMDGSPIWTVTKGLLGSGRYEFICGTEKGVLFSTPEEQYLVTKQDLERNYGKTWLAYRHKPKEG